MKKFLTILAAAFACLSLSAQTPFLEQLQKRDSILIADQLLYGVLFEKVPEGTGIAPSGTEGHGFGEDSPAVGLRHPQSL